MRCRGAPGFDVRELQTEIFADWMGLEVLEVFSDLSSVRYNVFGFSLDLA